MTEKNRPLIDKICLDFCDVDKCQRYPQIAESCEKYLKFLRVFETARRETAEKLFDEMKNYFMEIREGRHTPEDNDVWWQALRDKYTKGD